MAKTKKNTKTQKPVEPQTLPASKPAPSSEPPLAKDPKKPVADLAETKPSQNVLSSFLENKEDLSKKIQTEKLKVEERRKKFSLPQADEAEKIQSRELKFGGAQKKVLLERSKKFGLTGNEESNQLVRMRMAKFQSDKVQSNQQKLLRAQKFGAPIRKMRKLA